ncbi:MAG: DUF814 domain-containing protein, partial [Thermoplasmata archaeon]|nr:DUF814 domain-containing protein [Thermoplasmata archaeon]
RTFTSANLKSVDFKKGAAVLEFEGNEIPVDIEKTIHKNAQVFYERVKKAKRKLESIRLAMKKSKKDLASASKRAERIRKEKAQPERRKKRFWFERFKWFFSSEGFLVVGGRDAKSNERLFRKHLEPGDRFVHADITGAPSVVVKEGSNAPEETLKEACRFALAHSKAWNAKLASGSAYWVKPEQVSKTPETGEYLPRGSFVIRGKRNSFHHLEMSLGIGEVEHEGQRLLMCAPPSSLEKKAKRFVVFTPGDSKRNTFVKELAAEFRVSVDDVSQLLPPGDVEVVGRHGL